MNGIEQPLCLSVSVQVLKCVLDRLEGCSAEEENVFFLGFCLGFGGRREDAKGLEVSVFRRIRELKGVRRGFLVADSLD